MNITVDVNINISDDTKYFILSLVNQPSEGKPLPREPQPEKKPTVKKGKSKKAEKEVEEEVEEAPEVEAPAQPETPTQPESPVQQGDNGNDLPMEDFLVKVRALFQSNGAPAFATKVKELLTAENYATFHNIPEGKRQEFLNKVEFLSKEVK